MKRVIEIENLLACIPSRVECKAPSEMVRKLTKKFYHKTGTELRLEQQQKMKLISI